MGRRNNRSDKDKKEDKSIGASGHKYVGVVGHSYLSDKLFNKFVNMVMLDGKKSLAIKYVVYALEKLAKEFFPDADTDSEDGGGDAIVDVLKLALKNVISDVEVKSRRFGSTTYRIPVVIKESRQIYLAFKWIISSARERDVKSILIDDYGTKYVGRKGIAVKLLIELRLACKGIGGAGSAMEKSRNVKKLAEDNMHFAHLKF